MYYIQVSVFMGVFPLKKTHFRKGKFFSPSSVHVEQSVLSCGRAYAGGRGRVLREWGRARGECTCVHFYICPLSRRPFSCRVDVHVIIAHAQGFVWV